MALDKERRDTILHEPSVSTSYFPCFNKYQQTI